MYENAVHGVPQMLVWSVIVTVYMALSGGFHLGHKMRVLLV